MAIATSGSPVNITLAAGKVLSITTAVDTLIEGSIAGVKSYRRQTSSNATIGAYLIAVDFTVTVTSGSATVVQADPAGDVLNIDAKTNYDDVSDVASKSTSVSLGGGGAFQALTDAASISTTVSASANFKVTLAGNRTLANPTGMSEGISYFWRIQQDATGSRTLAFGTMFKFAGGVAPTLTSAANAVDIIVGRYDGTILLCASALNVA